MPNPPTNALYPSPRTASFAGVLASANAIKTSIATVAGAASYSGGALNGSIGAGTMDPPRTVSVTTAVHAASYIAGSTVTFTGTDLNGAAQTEVLTLTLVNGGETVVGAKGFRTVTQIDVQAQADALGAFTFGVRDVMLPGCRGIRVGTGGDLKVGYEGGFTDTIPKVLGGESLPLCVVKVFGDASTTAQDITVLY